MKTIFKILFEIVVYAVVALFIFENLPKIIFDFNFKTQIIEKSKEHSSAVIVFDDFSGTDSNVVHGEIVSDLLQSLIKKDTYSLFELDYSNTNGYEDLFFMSNILLDADRELFVNISFAPKTGLASSVLVQQLTELSNHKNAHITVASGNNQFTRYEASKILLKHSPDLKVDPVEFESYFYNQLSLDVDRLSDIVLSGNEVVVQDFVQKKYIAASAFQIANAFGLVDSRERLMSLFIRKHLETTFKYFNINHSESLMLNMSDLYQKNINPFLFTFLLQNKSEYVHIVDAYLPFDLLNSSYIEMSDVGYSNAKSKMDHDFLIKNFSEFNYYLNCPVSDFIQSDNIDLGLYYIKKDKEKIATPILGTSIAAPAFLAKIINDSLQ